MNNSSVKVITFCVIDLNVVSYPNCELSTIISRIREIKKKLVREREIGLEGEREVGLKVDYV